MQGPGDRGTDQRFAAGTGVQADLRDRGILTFWVKILPVKSLRVLNLTGLFKLCFPNDPRRVLLYPSLKRQGWGKWMLW
jgi:hypothetical protein